MAQSQRIGRQLGNYRLTRLLGTGGFAEVYLGEQVHLRTEAAIKVLHTRLEPEDVAAFGDEARTIARLKHPHIVRVLDFGIDGTLPYLVMDYVPQGSLRNRHPRGMQLPLETANSYVKQLASALQYAHERKLIHRDLKPENILVDESGELVLSDFGIATMAQSSRSQNTQDIVGTAAYMAPEQLQGRPRPASDQYSFGIMAYEWLTGTRPFQGTFTEIASQHVLTPPLSLREERPDLPLAIEQVIMTALQKDPHQRFGSVKAFATAFEQAYEQSLQNAHEAAIETQRVSDPPDQRFMPPSTHSPVEQVGLTQTVEAGRTLPAVDPTRSVTLSDDAVMTPRFSPPLITSQPGMLVGQRRKMRRGWLYGIIAALFVVALAVTGVGIYRSQQVSTGGSNLTGVQIIGPDITNVQTGGVYDPSIGQILYQSSVFHVGDTVYLVSNILPADMQSSGSLITDSLIYPAGAYIPLDQGNLDPTHNTYFNSIVVTITGNYTWQVSYNSQLEASITFQVV